MEVLFHIFHYCWGEENRSLYPGLPYGEAPYIEVPLYCIFKQWKTFSVFAEPDINTRGVRRIRDSNANPRRNRGFVENSPNLSSVYIKVSKYRKKFSIAFIT